MPDLIFQEKFEFSGGYLVGSVGGACDSWSQGCELESHIGCGYYLNIKKKYGKIEAMEVIEDRKR